MSIELLYKIAEQLNIYVSLIMFVFGLIGCLWNMLIFRHPSLRSSACCIYMFLYSIASLLQLLFGLLFRMLGDGFHADDRLNHVVWCRIRYYVTQCSSLTALSCFIWIAMDRFFSTCRSLKWRSLSSTSIARYLCLFTILVWMISALPHLFYTIPSRTSSTSTVCISSSIIWTQILTYFINLFCYGIFPWFFMTLFGFLTLKNLRHIRQQRIHPIPNTLITRMTRVDKQLTSILFLQILICLISSIPYCIQCLYENITSYQFKTIELQAQEYLFLQIVRLAFYFNYISMFYVNYFSSPIFRRLSKKVLRHLCRKRTSRPRATTLAYQSRRQTLRPTMVPLSTLHVFHATTTV